MKLYTGLHAETVIGGSDVIQRFRKGRSFVVRVKPSEPEVSVMRDDDQSDGTAKRLERIDEQNRNTAGSLTS